MADKKISALTAASTPLAGTEVLPIVQSGSTVKVSVNNLTTGKTVAMNQINLDNSTVGFPTLGTASGSFRMLGSGGGGFGLFGGLDGGTGRSWLQAMRTDGAVAYDLRLQPVGGNVRVGAGDVIIETTGKGITTGSAIPLGLGVNGTVTAITIDTASNVGVGTTSPGRKLTVATSGENFQLRLGDANAIGVYDIGRSAVSGAFTVYGNQTGFTAFVFGGVDGERMRIDTSGNVGIGTAAPAATALLDVQSTTKGVRFPNMTTAQKNAITPSAGTVIFDTTLAKLCVYSGAAWQTITSV